MRVCILSGSARKNNNTLRVAKAISNNFIDSVIVDFQDYDLPNFNQTCISKKNLSGFQSKLINSIEKSDLLFVISPEYNWFPTAEIINTIHQLAQEDYIHIFDHKVIATVGVSAGRGGRMPAVQLVTVINKIIGFFNLESIISGNTFEVQEVTRCIDGEGLLLDNEQFNKGLTSFINYSLKVAERWHLNK
ncbi:MAG: NAD(P)H-dependent oxidoreductase [Bacteroidia bacterium]|nr:NAD(P)H-dependent oxidoreductase [Bacteroidia bacterium]|tara:strand:+ start:1356 stop:1925 length:570 start_codon:yes stop_codon:yes gene_type:complete